MRNLCILTVLLAAAHPAVAADYFVDARTGRDANPGTSASRAWRSLGAVNAHRFRPGDRLLFRAGTRYAGALRPHGSGARGNLVRLGAYGKGARPRIDGGGLAEAAVTLSNVEYWELAGLEVTNRGAARRAGRMGVALRLRDFGTAHGIVLRDLYIHDVNGSNVKKAGAGAGIGWSCGGQRRRSRFDGLRIEGCRLERCDRNGIIGEGHWTREEWYPSLHVVIRGNRLEDIGGDGIVPIACDGCLVERNVLLHGGARIGEGEAAAGIWPWSCDNTVVQFNEVSGQRGPWDAQGFDSDWNCRNTLIQYNYSHDNEGGFLLICNDGSSQLPYNVGNLGTVVRYNVSVNDGYRTTGHAAGFSPTFHVAGPVQGARIYNNTIVVGRKRSAAVDHDLVKMGDWSGYASDTRFENNLFVCEEPAGFDLAGARGTRLDHNLYAGVAVPTEEVCAAQGGLRLSWSGIAPSGLAAAAIFRPGAGSAAFGAGRLVESPGAHDYAGAPLRKHGPRSVGAFEPAAPSPGAKPSGAGGRTPARRPWGR